MKKYSAIPSHIMDKVAYIREREEKKTALALRRLENRIAYHIVRNPDAGDMFLPLSQDWFDGLAMDELRKQGISIDPICENNAVYGHVIGHRIILK